MSCSPIVHLHYRTLNLDVTFVSGIYNAIGNVAGELALVETCFRPSNSSSSLGVCIQFSVQLEDYSLGLKICKFINGRVLNVAKKLSKISLNHLNVKT